MLTNDRIEWLIAIVEFRRIDGTDWHKDAAVAWRELLEWRRSEGHHCPYCGNDLPDERAPCCGEVGHAEPNTPYFGDK